jgi:hypothetical protein
VSHGPHTFKETDVARLLKAARKAHVKIRIDIENGHLSVTMIDEGDPDAAIVNPWDEVLEK